MLVSGRVNSKFLSEAVQGSFVPSGAPSIIPGAKGIGMAEAPAPMVPMEG